MLPGAPRLGGVSDRQKRGEKAKPRRDRAALPISASQRIRWRLDPRISRLTVQEPFAEMLCLRAGEGVNGTLLRVVPTKRLDENPRRLLEPCSESCVAAHESLEAQLGNEQSRHSDSVRGSLSSCGS